MAEKTIEEKVADLVTAVETLGKKVDTYDKRFESLEELATEAVEKTDGIAPSDTLAEKRPPITVTKGKAIYTAKVEQIKVVTKEGLKVINLRDLPDAELLEYATSDEFSSKFSKA